MRKLFIMLSIFEIMAVIVILNYFPDNQHITPLFYTLTCSLVMLLMIVAITYYAEYSVLKSVQARIKYYGVIYEKNGTEYLMFKDMKTHRAFYNKEIDYINPSLIESLILQEQPMNNYIQFVSEDFKLRVPRDCTNIGEFIVDYVNANSITKFILDAHGNDGVRLINIADPQDTITFRQQ